jgi:hypothetical protein
MPESVRDPGTPLTRRVRRIDASPDRTPGHAHRTQHFGRELGVQTPPAALYAGSFFFALIERLPLDAPSDMWRQYHADCLARAAHLRSAVALAASPSALHDADWARIVCLSTTPAVPRPRAHHLGDLAGTWEGTLVVRNPLQCMQALIAALLRRVYTGM